MIEIEKLNVAVLIIPYSAEIQRMMEKLLNDHILEINIASYRFITEPKDIISQLETVNMKMKRIIKAQKYEEAAAERDKENELINMILGVKDFKNYLIEKRWILESTVFIFGGNGIKNQ